MTSSKRHLDPSQVLHQAMAELASASEAVDWLSHNFVSSIALLDASRVLHNALIVLGDLSSSWDDGLKSAKAGSIV